MRNTHFQFRQFTIHQERCAMKVTTDSCLFGAWCAREVQDLKIEGSMLLDVGAGTGLLSLMTAQKTNSVIDAIEVDKEAANQATENIQASPWNERITLFNDDVLQWRPQKKYDVIISNPPFHEGSLQSYKQTKNTAHHSTQLTLSALLHFIKMHLATEGFFFLLLPYQRLQELKTLASQQALCLTKIVYVSQSTLHHPFRVMVQGSFIRNEETKRVEIAIKDAKNGYTQGFTALLKDYYLNL